MPQAHPALSGTALLAVQFFKANPDEELTRSDASDKWALPVGALESVLQPAVSAGLITMANSGDLGRVWRAGPMLKHWKPDGGTPPAGNSQRGGRRVRLPQLDLAKLTVSTDMPLPSHGSEKGRTKHDELLNRLTADGMSVTGIPADYYGAVAKAVQTYLENRPTLAAASVFKVRRTSPTEFGVWRLAKSANDSSADAAPPATKTTKPAKKAA